MQTQPQRAEFFYLIDTAKPFRGVVQSTAQKNESGQLIVHYTNGMTLEEYQAERGLALEVLTESEIDAKLTAYWDSLVTKPEEITEEQYDYWLECLPPCRFNGNRFHLSERITGNLVQWCFKKGGKHYGFTDHADITEERFKEIFESVGA